MAPHASIWPALPIHLSSPTHQIAHPTHSPPPQAHDAPTAQPGADGPFSFCSYPFLLNARAKSRLLHTEARLLMTQTVHAARAEHVAGGASGLGGRGDERVLPAKAARRAGGDEAVL